MNQVLLNTGPSLVFSINAFNDFDIRSQNDTQILQVGHWQPNDT